MILGVYEIQILSQYFESFIIHFLLKLISWFLE
jgi:hypothetical protein